MFDGMNPVDGFSPLRIKEVVRETRDALSLVLDIPESEQRRFTYQAGQFLTLRVTVGGQEYRRCYSMSSSPALQQDLRVTVKRDGAGVVSNWLNDHAAPGDQIEAAAPEGRFVRSDSDRELIAFAGGSGITPVYSLIQTVLAAAGRARLLYANRAAESVIFADALAGLADRHEDRFVLHHHLDAERGVVTAEIITEFLGATADVAGADYYVCGPAPFMDTVEQALLSAGVPADQLFLERFSVAPVPVDDEAPVTEEVTIELDRQTVTVDYRAGNTLLQTARMAGLKAPSSCETGSCGTCIAQVTEGSARLLNNDALDDDEIAEGFVVTCQALPTSRTIRFVYE
ncbi:ferredoxin--NADP reductase [Mycolicibacterium bacteremicum]|uniref:Ferredoxin n=2 Tax=Mycolicibacterium bacteremicum TaxID=564198 RepID=A0A1W9YYR8_MYCBA|nr:ferredoxin--NADP reductase [Mycolicibacterium bacteremicum]ORA05119.1 ferredoxin [Mycolicibacterium bacteremicum]